METKKTSQTTPSRMYIDAKVMSGVRAILKDKDDQVIKYYDGPVPKFMPGQHWGEYLRLEIDLKTGRILNWKATKKDIAEFMNDEYNASRLTDPDPNEE